MKIKCILIIIFFTSFKLQAQDVSAQLVFFEDLNLIQYLGKIINENNSCPEGVWYVEFKNSKNIILSKGFLSNFLELIELEEERKLYATTINDNVVFIRTKDELQGILKKTHFHIDLSPYSELDFIYFSHFPYWYIQHINNSYVIVKKDIFKCK